VSPSHASLLPRELPAALTRPRLIRIAGIAAALELALAALACAIGWGSWVAVRALLGSG
jgi:hypothetical protein